MKPMKSQQAIGYSQKKKTKKRKAIGRKLGLRRLLSFSTLSFCFLINALPRHLTMKITPKKKKNVNSSDLDPKTAKNNNKRQEK